MHQRNKMQDVVKAKYYYNHHMAKGLLTVNMEENVLVSIGGCLKVKAAFGIRVSDGEAS